MAEITELESAPTREDIDALNKILAVAESMLAFATNPRQLQLMEEKVGEMRADRDKYAEQLERLESSNEPLKKAGWKGEIGGAIVELEGLPARETLVALDKILSVAQSAPALADSPELRKILETKVAAMKADRDQYAAQVERLENRHK